MTGLVYLADVVTLQLDQELCIGCGTCEIVCPHAVFQMTDGLAEVRDRNACMECGACAQNCPSGAISVDAGVGCATAVIMGALRRTEPTCGCSQDSSCC